MQRGRDYCPSLIFFFSINVCTANHKRDLSIAIPHLSAHRIRSVIYIVKYLLQQLLNRRMFKRSYINFECLAMSMRSILFLIITKEQWYILHMWLWKELFLKIKWSQVVVFCSDWVNDEFQRLKNKNRGSLMADSFVLCCKELINFPAGDFALKQALTWPPLENTTCPGFTLSPGHSWRVTSWIFWQE